MNTINSITVTPELKERFFQKVRVNENGCTEWTGYRAQNGYGQLTINHDGKWGAMYAHRVAYMIEHGDIPKGMFVCHKCDNPSCVNPEHLFLGTNRENMLDASRKGRVSRTHQGRGESHGMHVLTEVQVIEIRRLLAAGAKGRTIAKSFGVSECTISAIKHGRKWKHLSAE